MTTASLQYPKPLRAGDTIALTAPSSGVPPMWHPRLDLAIAHLEALGFRVVEGQCLRAQFKDASAPADERAAEWMHFMCNPAIAAVMPPWGGERACDLLPLLDFDALRTCTPKWHLGFSDLSTLHLPLALISGWASAHGANLMQRVPAQRDALTSATLTVLATPHGASVRQNASTRFETHGPDISQHPDAPFALTEPSCWKQLNGNVAPVRFSGRLIGGCIDTIAWLAGSRFGDVPSFVRRHRPEGTVLYLENAEMPSPGLLRALLALRRMGWFDDLAGLLIGRSAGANPLAPDRLSYTDALTAVLGDLRCPVLIDVDIGHLPPQLTLINGALAEVHFAEGRGSITQHFV
ncbi:S66 peptidase family protein [Niveibacterium sp.]|uniref:S66 family peptidase n=1 Tax=Niveibacterium sp. TaxID=2017444 RepID=UPI0035AE67D9